MHCFKQKVQKSFNKAAKHYDQHASLQRLVAERLTKMICEQTNKQHRIMVDLGCGTGYLSRCVATYLKPYLLLGFDLAEQMCKKAQQILPSICADIEQLPLQDHCCHVVTSNLAIQWCTNLNSTIAELARILKPGGQLWLTSFGPNTLNELKHCWQQLDHNKPVNTFHNQQQLQHLLQCYGLINITITSEMHTYYYHDFKMMLCQQKHIGANVSQYGRKHLTGKSTFTALQHLYANLYATRQQLRASYEILYIQAEKAKD